MNTLTKGARVGPHGFDSSCIWRAFSVVAVPDGPLRTLHTRVASELGVRDYVSPVDHPMGGDRVRHHSIYTRGRTVSTGTLLARAMRVEMAVARESADNHNCQKQCDPGSLQGSRHLGCLVRTPCTGFSRSVRRVPPRETSCVLLRYARGLKPSGWLRGEGRSIDYAARHETNGYTRRLVETGYSGRGRNTRRLHHYGGCSSMARATGRNCDPGSIPGVLPIIIRASQSRREHRMRRMERCRMR